ncbi:beta-ketoacyl-[acyl-carrier-protein] synthase family protein [Janthinobacterium agaricidamnosum]|uniref:Nodulation protein E n=1 Tax=Janthinobacterium agaricidamnosum NBRC 102515 = DSM 9628 TaxID=1349767 RepID=W0V1B5_9BURK|nr:beta-ketoacyl-[acyl-carrier-protein] synthase family protein [Janthinobacterium agaricidamnosum]CDG81666.1 3-oxoacyl-[acyl-carrier-protein] synthase 2 [Janthinobacterium agaricidamnosum NBRC 102515 = DSM 9628]
MDMNARRVVVTGMGVVSAAGNDLSSFWDQLSAARSGIRTVSHSDDNWGATPQRPERLLAGKVELAPLDGLPEMLAEPYLDDFSRFALHAAGQALAQAGIAAGTPHARGIGVILGTAIGGDEAYNQAAYRAYVKRRPPAPQTILRAMYNAAASSVTMAYGLHGPSMAISSACASASHAIGQACLMIRSGLAERMLAGGSEQLPSYVHYGAWRQMRVLSPDGCRPFCASRNGIVLGEGAGLLLLESLQAARARGAAILGEICGFGLNAAASDWLRPDAASMADCMRLALDQAGWHAGQVGFINAHGTGTVLNDHAEALAIRQVFGDHAAHVPVSSSKGMHGHALGASGALECIAALLSLAHGQALPNGAQHQPDPECALDIVSGACRPLAARRALSNSFAFGGLHAVLALALQPTD